MHNRYKKYRSHIPAFCRNTDTALLFLRLFIGAIVLMHNVGKLQDYDDIINTYPALLFNSPQISFTVFSILECLFAVMIIMGLKLRFAAFIMSIGMFLSIFVAIRAKDMTASVLQFVYMGIYIFFTLSGAGRYAFDSNALRRRRHHRKKRYHTSSMIDGKTMDTDEIK